MHVDTFLQAEVLAILVKRADKIEAVVALGELNANVRLLAGLLVDQEKGEEAGAVDASLHIRFVVRGFERRLRKCGAVVVDELDLALDRVLRLHHAKTGPHLVAAPALGAVACSRRDRWDLEYVYRTLVHQRHLNGLRLTE